MLWLFEKTGIRSEAARLHSGVEQGLHRSLPKCDQSLQNSSTIHTSPHHKDPALKIIIYTNGTKISDSQCWELITPHIGKKFEVPGGRGGELKLNKRSFKAHFSTWARRVQGSFTNTAPRLTSAASYWLWNTLLMYVTLFKQHLDDRMLDLEFVDTANKHQALAILHGNWAWWWHGCGPISNLRNTLCVRWRPSALWVAPSVQGHVDLFCEG